MHSMTGMFSTLKPVLPEAKCPRNGCLSAKTLFNSQRETYFLLKPDAPKTNAFHVKDVVSIEPFLFDTMPPKWMPFVATVLNAKPFLFHIVLPTWMPFLSMILSTLNPFCLTYILPLKQMMADVLNVNPLFCSSKFWKRRSEL